MGKIFWAWTTDETYGFYSKKMLKRQGKRLSNLDVHDIICMIGDCVVSGGVRRSAMISLSDLDDEQVRDAKTGQLNTDPQRMLANNSAVYLHKPTSEEFMDVNGLLVKSGSGEREYLIVDLLRPHFQKEE